MYYVETRADNSGYTNHRVTCLVVMGSPFDSEQVFEFHFNAYHNYWKIVFFEEGGITQIKCWMELSCCNKFLF
jgi:hypothetical protein